VQREVDAVDLAKHEPNVVPLGKHVVGRSLVKSYGGGIAPHKRGS
jgi:hypothetical protein